MARYNHKATNNSRTPEAIMAAADFYRHSEFERALYYPKAKTLAYYTPAKPRIENVKVCASSCGRNECRMGCTLSGQFD